MPAPIIAGVGAAGIAAALGKSAATVGLSAAGGVASYYIVDAARAKHDPMIGHAILTTATQTDSDSLVAVNFSGAESGLVIIAILLVVGMIVYKVKDCLCLKCCGKQQKTSQKKWNARLSSTWHRLPVLWDPASNGKPREITRRLQWDQETRFQP